MPDARRDAAETLHPLYEADGDAERLLKVLEIEADAADTPDQRLRLLEQATSVAETRQSNAARAFGYAVRGVREAAGEPEITAWLERAERLAMATDRYEELVKLEREVLPNILDEEVQLTTSLRIGELARTKLGDRDLARSYYQKALELRGDDRRALIALESLYEEGQDGPALLEILKRRVESAENDDETKAAPVPPGQALGRNRSAIKTRPSRSTRPSSTSRSSPMRFARSRSSTRPKSDGPI